MSDPPALGSTAEELDELRRELIAMAEHDLGP